MQVVVRLLEAVLIGTSSRGVSEILFCCEDHVTSVVCVCACVCVLRERCVSVMLWLVIVADSEAVR